MQMISMRMSIDHTIDPIDIGLQHLMSKIRSGINQNAGYVIILETLE
jgi:hypothetical protein